MFLNFKLSQIKYGHLLICLCVVTLFLLGCIEVPDRSAHHFVPRDLRQYVVRNCNRTETNLTIDEIIAYVDRANARMTVRNVDQFDPVAKDTMVLAVLVHRDIERLQHLIISLAQVRGIENALLIFSHSYYDEKINDLIQSITFCKVLQIFFPYSNQLQPNQFPVGDSHSDGNQTRARNATLIERKQHWWWRASFIFEKPSWSRSFDNFVLFLDESDYVLPDALHVLQFARAGAQSYLRLVQLVALGGPPRPRSLREYDVVRFEPWGVAHEAGLAFNKSSWLRMKARAAWYCMYDELDWSRSLLNLFQRYPPRQADMLAAAAPRVLSTRSFATGRDAAESYSYEYRYAPLFPERMFSVFIMNWYGKLGQAERASPRGSGGFGDLRDQLQCMDPLAEADATEDLDTTTAIIDKLKRIAPMIFHKNMYL